MATVAGSRTTVILVLSLVAAMAWTATGGWLTLFGVPASVLAGLWGAMVMHPVIAACLVILLPPSLTISFFAAMDVLAETRRLPALSDIRKLEEHLGVMTSAVARSSATHKREDLDALDRSIRAAGDWSNVVAARFQGHPTLNIFNECMDKAVYVGTWVETARGEVDGVKKLDASTELSDRCEPEIVKWRNEFRDGREQLLRLCTELHRRHDAWRILFWRRQGRA